MVTDPALRILVTGATGFLGRHILRGLLDDGQIVGAIVRPTSETTTLDARCELLTHDASTGGLFDLLEQFEPDVVVHAATLFVAAHQPDQIKPLVDANILFGAQLLDAMARTGARKLVNFGTSWQHFDSENYRPATLYASTKQCFEDLAAYYADAERFSILTLKLPDTYGPDDARKKLMHLLLHTAKTGALLEMSPGEQRISLVHCADVVHGVRIAIDRVRASEPGMEAFALRGGDPMPLKELVGQVETALGVKLSIRWGARPYREREVMSPWIGPLLPGWAPQICLQDGIRDMARQEPTSDAYSTQP